MIHFPRRHRSLLGFLSGGFIFHGKDLVITHYWVLQQAAGNISWEILVNVDMTTTLLLQICQWYMNGVNLCSITPQRCSTGLISDCYGGHLPTVSSFSCSRNQLKLWALWHGVISCWKQPSEKGYTVLIKRCTRSAIIVRWAVACKWCSVGTKMPTLLHPYPEPLLQGRMNSCWLH